MRSVFIAGAYSTGGGEAVAVNVRNAMSVWHELAYQNFAPFCPHLSHFLHMHKPKPRDIWLDHDNHWLLKCDCVLRLPGESEGADDECKLAHRNHVPVFYSIADVVEFYKKPNRRCDMSDLCERLRNAKMAAGTCLEAADEIERLRAEHNSLPHFADGTVSFPGMEGWHPSEEEPGEVGETGGTCGNDEWGCGADECYSTKAKAKAARAE